MAVTTVDLEPPDPKRCQAEVKAGSFMTLGPRPLIRCEKAPIVIAEEVEPDEDGQRGSMSLCADCWAIFQQRDDLPRCRFTPIQGAST